MNSRPVRALLLDLDGTLIDTAGDLASAVNSLLAHHHRPTLPFEQLRPYVSQGGLTMVSIAFQLERESDQAFELWQQYLEIYAANISHHSRLFDGMERVLEVAESAGVAWGVVTNKPEYLTLPLLRALKLQQRAGCIVGGDTLAEAKPSPAPVLHACESLGVAPAEAVMVGDDRRDIDAGRAAGSRTIAAGWGYIQPDDSPDSWGADQLMDHPSELHEWIN